MTKYLTNFHRGKTGNKLAYATDLIIKIDGASIVTGRLEKLESGKVKVIQIEQSGRKSNPWPDKVKFEMIEFDGKGGRAPMPRGSYLVEVWYWVNNKGGHFTDKFEIE